MNYLILILLSMMVSNEPNTGIHQFKIQALNSDEVIDFSDFEGKKILIVNVASKCGFTYQYEDLEKLYQEYKDKLVVIGFPCNQFLGQEPGSEEKIESFCSSTYGVTFPMTTKINVKGKEQHPIYKWLTSKDLNGKDNYKISWNFNKFLLDEEGQLIEYYGSKVKPMDEAITKHLN
ncbi:MAG: glutathione peroxidase [Saprospiraceae bacterium]